MEKIGMIVGTYEVQPGDHWFLKDGRFFAFWWGGPHDGQPLTRDEFGQELKALGVLECRICKEKIFTGWVHVDIVYPEKLVFAQHAGCVR